MEKEVKGVMKIYSSVFENKGRIPDKYTCKGENVNPALVFSGVPEGAKSLVLIVDDPDAPMGTRSTGSGQAWVHWVVYDIPVSAKGIGEGSAPEGGKEGVTSFGEAKYGGPCPPSGEHRYFFKLYALDVVLELGDAGGVDKSRVEEAMEGHVIERAELMGVFGR